jgi:archaemetzincin
MKTCFMRDAEGGNPLNEEKEFCSTCKSFLVKKGWRLN